MPSHHGQSIESSPSHTHTQGETPPYQSCQCKQGLHLKIARPNRCELSQPSYVGRRKNFNGYLLVTSRATATHWALKKKKGGAHAPIDRDTFLSFFFFHLGRKGAVLYFFGKRPACF